MDSNAFELAVRYRADAEPRDDWWQYVGQEQHEKYTGANFNSKWRPSIFMPRWASRIELEIIDVRVEQVQEITPDDALAEGVQAKPYVVHPPIYEGIDDYLENGGSVYDCPGVTVYGSTAEFARLWDSINADRGYPFSDNVWVWVVEFKQV